MRRMGRLDDKVAVITGGDGTIGLATARLFLDEGARVLLVGHLGKPLEEAARGLDAGGRVAHCVADVRSESEVRRYFDEAERRFGGVDVFFDNAGVEGAMGPLAGDTVENFEAVMAVNVTGVFLGLKHAFPALAKRGGGSVVVTSSVAGIMGLEGAAAYCASKHAVIGLMRVAALEGAKQGIRVNTVNPAMVEGRMMRSIEDGIAPGHGDAVKAALEARIPLGRYAQPEEVARLVLFLASDESAYITNSVYKIDGGMAF